MTIDIYIVTFRHSNDKLTSMFTWLFRSEKETRAFIKEDAEFYCSKHPKAKIKGFKKDGHFEIEDEDGTLYYQYFRI